MLIVGKDITPMFVPSFELEDVFYLFLYTIARTSMFLDGKM